MFAIERGAGSLPACGSYAVVMIVVLQQQRVA